MAGDGGERPVGYSVVFETGPAHDHDVLGTLVFADQLRSSDRPVISADPAQDRVLLQLFDADPVG
jgi:hypothetical protein